MVLPGVGGTENRSYVRYSVITNVVRNRLIVPGKLARGDIQRDDRVGVKIRARTILVVEVGGGIAHRYIQQALFRIVGHRSPDISSTVLERFWIVPPTLGAWFAGIGHGVEFPNLIPV